MADYKSIIDAYKDLPGGIIEAYHALQREFSYIPEEAIPYAAQVFGVSKPRAHGVATFYSYLRVGKRGKNVIRICEKAPPVHIAGADKWWPRWKKYWVSKWGESTSDGPKFNP
jgi:NADH-quinone oxidoreductase subunit E